MKHRIPKETVELDLEQQKQAIAYQLWEDEGCPDGKAEEHWDKACLIVMSLAEGETATSPAWLKRNEGDETRTADPLPILDSLTKRHPARHAA